MTRKGKKGNEKQREEDKKREKKRKEEKRRQKMRKDEKRRKKKEEGRKTTAEGTKTGNRTQACGESFSSGGPYRQRSARLPV